MGLKGDPYLVKYNFARAGLTTVDSLTTDEITTVLQPHCLLIATLIV